MGIVIRPERPEDYYASELVTKRAFWNHYRPGCDEHYLVHKLRDDPDYLPALTRVAEADGRIVGLIMYTKACLKTEEAEIPVILFGPLGVDPDWQRQGIGGMLLKDSLQAAREMGHRGVIIFGDPGYYPRFGFRPCSEWGITTADGGNSPAFMGLALVPGGLDYPGARFFVPPVYENLSPDEVEAFDKGFPYMEKLRLPGQMAE